MASVRPLKGEVIHEFLHLSGKEVQARWRSIRDAYVKKHRKRQHDAKSGFKVSRPYIFSDQLSFLKKFLVKCNAKTVVSPLVKEEETKVAKEEGTEEATQESTFVEASTHAGGVSKKRKISLSDVMTRLLESQHERMNEDRDDDRNFFMSLLPIVRTLNEDQKLEFRMQVMQLVRLIKSGQFMTPLIPQSPGFSNLHPIFQQNQNFQPLLNQVLASTTSTKATPVQPNNPLSSPQDLREHSPVDFSQDCSFSDPDSSDDSVFTPSDIDSDSD